MRTFLLLSLLLVAHATFSQCSVDLGDDITQCNGNPITISAITNGTESADSITIVYDATQGVTGLVGANKVYFHSGLEENQFGGWEYQVGNWGADDGLGEMTSIGTNLWSITINVQAYYGIAPGANQEGIFMVFRNADGSATGKDENDDDIYLHIANNYTSDFGGVTGTFTPESLGSLLWSTNEATENITVTQTGTYSVTYTDGTGCQATDDVYVEFGSGNVIVDLGPDTALCNGDIITLDAGSGFVSYEWSTMETGQTLDVSLPGDYSVTVTDAQGCTGIDLVNVTTGASPLAQFSYSPVTGTTVEFTDDGVGATTVYWDFDGDGNIDETTAGGASVQYDFGAETVFGVTMIAENDCGSDTTSQNVLVQDVGLEELKNEIGFSVYPNPTSDVSTMSITDQQVSVSAIQIFDLNGKGVLEVPASGNSQLSVQTNKLSAGVYVLQVRTSKGIINHRLIKQ